MSKELTPLQALQNIKKLRVDCDPESWEIQPITEVRKQELGIIETALKEKEQQDNLLKIIRETIEFGITNTKVEENENGDMTMSGRIGIALKREIDQKERQLFRDWILSECCPKELKALQIIKNKGIDVSWFKYSLEYCVDDTNALKHYNIGCDIGITFEEFKLLKEVLK